MSESKTTGSAVPEDEIIETSHEAFEPSFGWNPYAELVNGRVAMLAVLGLLILEWFTQQDLFAWLGLRP